MMPEISKTFKRSNIGNVIRKSNDKEKEEGIEKQIANLRAEVLRINGELGALTRLVESVMRNQLPERHSKDEIPY